VFVTWNCDNLLLGGSGAYLADQDDHPEIGALQRMARKEDQLVMMAVPMLNWLTLLLKMRWMSPGGLRKRKASHGISISVRRSEFLHRQGCLKM